MFFALRMVGWGFLALGFIFLVRDVFGTFGTDHGFHPRTLADLWNSATGGGADDFHGRIVFNYGPWVWWCMSLVLNVWAFAEFLLIGFVIDVLAREKVDRPDKRGAKAIAEAKNARNKPVKGARSARPN